MDDRFFAVTIGLGLFALGILIYVSVEMSKKRKDKSLSENVKKSAKTYEIVFAILSIFVGLFLILKISRHFHLKKKFLIF